MRDRCRLAVLGSTGSIGRQTLEVADRHPEKFEVVALAANNEFEEICAQIERYKPKMVAVGNKTIYNTLPQDSGIEFTWGLPGLCRAAAFDQADMVVIALSGAIGIEPTMAAIKTGKRVALANKETLVAAGEVIMPAVSQNKVVLLPIDSEHAAVHQCLRDEGRYLKNIWLTASGGPFRDYTREELALVTVEKALEHPNWNMGPKITIDSATLMNKGLEVIEAHHLFEADYSQIKVVIHRESIVHSLVEFIDGSWLAHIGTPDMRIPIQYALTYPERLESLATDLDLFAVAKMHFQAPDEKRFPCLALAYAAGQTGKTMPAVLNAANEVAVDAFLQQQIGFADISVLTEQVMNRHKPFAITGLDEVLAADNWARVLCEELINNRF